MADKTMRNKLYKENKANLGGWGIEDILRSDGS
jgi:hypothetical protein